jgi:hypothetical protein
LALTDSPLDTPLEHPHDSLLESPIESPLWDLFSAPIGTWSALKTAVGAAAGKTVTLTLSTPFDMTGFQDGSCIDITTAQTAITIVGNGAVFDAGGKDKLFNVYPTVSLEMSNVTLQNAYTKLHHKRGDVYGGAINVQKGGTTTLSQCIFSGNTCVEGPGGAVYNRGTATLLNCLFSGNAGGDGGAIYIGGGTATLLNCIFSGNTANGYGGAINVGHYYGDVGYYGTAILSNCIFSGNTGGAGGGQKGGALYFANTNSTGLLKNCSLLGTVSPNNNDIARYYTTTNVTFACADGEVGTPVQMSGTEITCTAGKYICRNGGKANWQCVEDSSGISWPDCQEVCSP